MANLMSIDTFFKAKQIWIWNQCYIHYFFNDCNRKYKVNVCLTLFYRANDILFLPYTTAARVGGITRDWSVARQRICSNVSPMTGHSSFVTAKLISVHLLFHSGYNDRCFTRPYVFIYVLIYTHKCLILSVVINVLNFQFFSV